MHTEVTLYPDPLGGLIGTKSRTIRDWFTKMQQSALWTTARLIEGRPPTGCMTDGPT